VAHTLTNSPSDQAQFAPLLDAIKTNLGKNPDEASADAGYCSQANLRTLIRRRIEATSPPDGKSTAPRRLRRKGSSNPARSSPE
jgi:hypothetical protein